MNDFDDLFEKQVKPQEDKEETPIDNFYRTATSQRKNLYMFLIYIFSSFLFALAALLISNFMFPDSESINNDLFVVMEPEITVTYDDDLAPVSALVHGIFVNNSEYDLPVFFVDMELFDVDENSLGTYHFTKNDLAAGQTYTLYETFDIMIEPHSYTMSWGFDFNSLFYIIINLLQVSIAAVLFLFIDFESFKQNWQAFRKQLKNHIGQIVVGFFLVFLALYAAQLILQFFNVTDTSENEMTIQGLFAADPTQLVLLFLLLCVFTPVVEEVVFRKVLFNYIEPRTNALVAIIASGAIFGLMHVIAYGDFIQSIPYIFMGLMFGYIYYRAKKNIFVTIGVHFLNNFYVFLAYVLILYGVIQ